ncbi:MAG: DMT family transporter [Chitinophagaceae bacterium]|nr:DMT family transporter [Chitinophagaceae bacterium]
MKFESGNWVLFILLSIVWGSSFILMKEGLIYLSAWEVASIRVIAAGLVLLPLAIKSFREIPNEKKGYVILSGTLGSLLPAYLFCIAEEQVSSALAGVFNSLTPVFVLFVGALFFGQSTKPGKILGITVAFLGSVLLFFSQENTQSNNIIYVMFIVIATFFYGLNVNIVNRHLKGLPSLKVVSLALVFNAIPAMVVLLNTDYFSKSFNGQFLWGTFCACILGWAGTALASVLFYKLIKQAGIVFSSMVTYGIPVVAIIWGMLYGEDVGIAQWSCMFIILLGVFLATRK